MLLRINGTITFLRKAKIKINSKRKNPATAKKPAAVLLKTEASQKARPVNKKLKKKHC